MDDMLQTARNAAALAWSVKEGLDWEYPEEVEPESYDECSYDMGQTFLIVTDEEADARCREYVRDSLWAFNADFIADHAVTNIRQATAALQKMQGELCEGANPIIAAILGVDLEDEDCPKLKAFAAAAVSADGRGHFLSGYDGDEHEFSDGGREWFAYRTN